MDNRATEIGTRPSLSITLSDLLGYVVPGATLLISIAFFEFRAKASSPDLPLATPFLTTFRIVVSDIGSPNLILGAALAVLLLVTSYVTGHVVASFSSLLVDRILVFKGYGYPYETLLRMEDDGYSPFSEGTAFFVRGAFSWGIAYLFFRYSEYAYRYLRVDHLARGFHLLAWYAAGTLVVLCLAQLVFVVLRNVWQQKEQKAQTELRLAGASKKLATPRIEADIASAAEHFLAERELPDWTKWPLLALRLCALPYDMVSRVIADPLNTRRAFNRQFIAQYRALFQRRFRISAEDATTNNFWLAYCHVIDRSPRLAGSVYNWLNLYGFSRNLATAFFLAFVYATCWLVVHAPLSAQFGGPTGTRWPLAGVAFLCMSLILLLRYYFLYVCYFTKFVFRAFVYSELAALPEKELPPIPADSVLS